VKVKIQDTQDVEASGPIVQAKIQDTEANGPIVRTKIQDTEDVEASSPYVKTKIQDVEASSPYEKAKIQDTEASSPFAKAKIQDKEGVEASRPVGISRLRWADADEKDPSSEMRSYGLCEQYFIGDYGLSDDEDCELKQYEGKKRKKKKNKEKRGKQNPNQETAHVEGEPLRELKEKVQEFSYALGELWEEKERQQGTFKEGDRERIAHAAHLRSALLFQRFQEMFERATSERER
jgi:hypothetical protein